MSKFLPFGSCFFFGEKAHILHTWKEDPGVHMSDEYFDIICSPQAQKILTN